MKITYNTLNTIARRWIIKMMNTELKDANDATPERLADIFRETLTTHNDAAAELQAKDEAPDDDVTRIMASIVL